jgi:asparagine synthetase B (glutamine-hydrolysing)
VKLRMRADVPVTMFLSGGIDSTIVAVLAGIKEAFTCQFDEFKTTIDEELYAVDFAEARRHRAARGAADQGGVPRRPAQAGLPPRGPDRVV